jgi:hypothetical protein
MRHQIWRILPDRQWTGGVQGAKGERSMRTYERPTLMSLGLFKDVTGLGGHGPRDALFQHQLI